MIIETLLLLGTIVSQFESHPYSCDKVIAYETKKGNLIFKTVQEETSEKEINRSKEIIKLVSTEMGADPRLFMIWAKRESKYKFDIVCVHPKDINANQDAWKDHLWSSEKDKHYSSILENPKHKNYWKAKDQYRKIQKFADNPYYHYQMSIPVFKKGTNEFIKYIMVNSWSFSYGLYSMNSPLYGEPDMPPWVHCSDDGAFSTIKAVWAARKFQNECASQGLGSTYGAVDRRFSTGHCQESPSKDFSMRARSHNLPVDKKAKLGKKFQKNSIKKDAILQHMKNRIEEECLTEDLYQTVLCKNPKATGFRSFNKSTDSINDDKK